MKNSVLVTLLVILDFVGFSVLGYLVVAGLTYIICLAFGLSWSWLMALGVWATCVLLRWIMSAAKGGGNK